MSSQKYHYRSPICQIPNYPSQQLKDVLDYLDDVKRLGLWRPQQAIHIAFYRTDLARVLALVIRTKSQYIGSFHTLRDSLNGAPLEVCFRLNFGFTFVSGELAASKHVHISSQREEE